MMEPLTLCVFRAHNGVHIFKYTSIHFAQNFHMYRRRRPHIMLQYNVHLCANQFPYCQFMFPFHS